MINEFILMFIRRIQHWSIIRRHIYGQIQHQSIINKF